MKVLRFDGQARGFIDAVEVFTAAAQRQRETAAAFHLPPSSENDEILAQGLLNAMQAAAGYLEQQARFVTALLGFYDSSREMLMTVRTRTPTEAHSELDAKRNRAVGAMREALEEA